MELSRAISLVAVVLIIVVAAGYASDGSSNSAGTPEQAVATAK
jgi:hypothetical protein